MKNFKTFWVSLLSGFFCGITFFPASHHRQQRLASTPERAGFARDAANLRKDGAHIYNDMRKAYSALPNEWR